MGYDLSRLKPLSRACRAIFAPHSAVVTVSLQNQAFGQHEDHGPNGIVASKNPLGHGLEPYFTLMQSGHSCEAFAYRRWQCRG